jgi:hypothetical protein
MVLVGLQLHFFMGCRMLMDQQISRCSHLHDSQERCFCCCCCCRAIAQANITREYLHSLVQDGYKMPAGPVIISPHGLLPSLYR